MFNIERPLRERVTRGRHCLYRLQRGRLVVVSNSLYFRIGLAAGSADRRKRYRHGRQSSRSSHSCEIDQRCVSTRAAIAGVTLPRPFPESLVRTAEGVVSEVE